MKVLQQLALLFALLVTHLAHGAELPDVTASMADFVEEGVVSGAVTLVAKDGEIVHLSATGKADLESGRVMKTDDLFWIASMTKPMVAVCVMMLQDEGKLNIHDPVEKYLPEFSGQWATAESTPDRRVLVKAARPVTIFDLLTHTGGIGDVSSPRSDSTLAELSMAYSREPLQFQPGEKWKYSNPGINILGRIIEVVSGQPFAVFFEKRLLTPLGMKETTFWPSESQLPRVVKSYERKDGAMVEIKPFLMKGDLADPKRTAFPSGGLYSTAEDVARFYAMMQNQGTLDGKTYLKKESVAEMIKNHTGDMKAGFTEGIAWGLGFQVVREPSENGATGVLSAGTYGHGGAYATQNWADPKTGLTFVLMIQQGGLGDGAEIRKVFQATAVKSLK